MKVTVKHVSSNGLKVSTSEGHEGFIPRGELSWSHSNPRPHIQFYEGQEIEVVEIKWSNSSDRYIFSVKQTKPDPWLRATNSYSTGQYVIGVVTSIFHDAVFIEIEEGVAGRIASNWLGPSFMKKDPDDLSLGDLIGCVISGCIAEKKHFLCNNTLAIDENEKKKSLKNYTKNSYPLIDTTPIKDPTISYHTGSISVLLIDDDESFCISTKRTFELSGHSLEYTQNPDHGIRIATEQSFDIVVVDLIMPSMRGDEVCKQIQSIDNNVQLAIFTGEGVIPDDVLQQLDPEPLVLYKPFDISDVESACFNEVSITTRHVPEIITEQYEFIKQHAVEAKLYPDEYVIDQTTKLKKILKTSFYGVFAWDIIELRLKYLTGEGFKIIDNIGQMERQIFYSPIRNIAEDKEIVVTNFMSESSEGFTRWMKNLSPYTEFFESFLGAPIVVQGLTRYVILFFDVMPNMFNEFTVERVLGKLSVIASELKVQEAYQQLASLQRLALRGELTASLAHEIRNRLHIVSMNLKALKKLGPKAAHKLRQRSSYVPEELNQLNEIVEESQNAVDRIGEVVSAISEDLSSRGYTKFDLGESIMTVISRLKPVAERKGVKIQFDNTQRCQAIGPFSRLGQVFENILLNAIQHTSVFRKNNSRIGVRYGIDEQEKYFVEVEDNGRGIHKKDFRRIFDMGYSTKEIGSGIGLALCLSTMKGIDGDVYVKDSIMFEGTTMRVEWLKKETFDE